MGKENSEAVGSSIRGWRAKQSLTQADLAAEAGISTRHLSFIETGRSRPGRDVLIRLLDALKLPLPVRESLLERAGYARVVGTPRVTVRTLKAPEEIHALAEPLRLDLLRAFGSPRSLGAAAELLEVPVTRLYRHVEVLAKAGLIELVEVQPKREELEKHYRTVASVFRVAPEMSGQSAVAGDACKGAGRALDAALGDVHPTPDCDAIAGPRIVARAGIRLGADDLSSLVADIERLFARYESAAQGDRVAYRFTVLGVPAGAPSEREALASRCAPGSAGRRGSVWIHG